MIKAIIAFAILFGATNAKGRLHRAMSAFRGNPEGICS